MASSASVYVTREEFNLFHSIDRELYAVLVLSLARDPAESMQVMALWLWLENRGFRHVVKTILSLPHFLVNEAADECVSLLLAASSGRISALSHFPLTQSLLSGAGGGLILAAVLAAAAPTLAMELADIVHRVCIRAMTEITAHINTNGNNGNSGEGGDGDEVPAVPAENRTMFVTFSKGYPVYEYEVREFFGRAYGDSCIESLHMQEVHSPNEQPLFARIVFKVVSTIDVILNGLSKAKFTINGKHVWMRRFIPKKPKSMPAPAPTPAPLPPPPPQDPHPLPNLPASLFD